MSDEHDLRDRLHAVVPEPPAAPGRAAAARSLAGRRRRRGTLVAVAGVVAAIVGAGLTVQSLRPDDRGTDRVATPSTPSSPPEVDAGAGITCPPPRTDGGTPPEGAALPTGATSARLCPVDAEGGFAAPVDALVSDVDSIVGAIEALPRYDQNQPCTMEWEPSYWLILGYPDGTTRQVEGSLAGCEVLQGAGPARTGAEGVWDRYLQLLGDQRASTTPPPAPDAVDCPASKDFSASSPLATPLQSVHAVLRWRDTDGSSSWSCAQIPDDDLAVILASLADPANTIRPGRLDCEQVLQFEIVGVNRWGDLGSMLGDCGAFMVGDRYRSPSQEAEDLMLAVVDAHDG
ncbi:hypothetical protein [Nocardioides sp. GXZ039]|uniref:hypothetical protein n=1 Tax=Nocardioides sp. GXZ039 TaxID=3136018 RepID=UPI0030F4303C